MIDVTVLTPSFGYAHYLPDCLDSVAAQQGVSVQHVVQDGASTDGTVELLADRDGLDWVSEPDDGQSDALNRALRRSTGRWIAWLNADEFLLPDALATVVRHGDASGDAIVYGDTAFVDADARLKRVVAPAGFSQRLLHGGRGCYLSSVSLLIRRDVLPDDPWDPTARFTMDWDLYLRLGAAGVSGSSVRTTIGAFREHDQRVTAAPRGEVFFAEKNRVAARYGPSHDELGPRRLQRDRWEYRVRKLLHGGYVRQRRAQRHVGADLRWWRDDVSPSAAHALAERG